MHFAHLVKQVCVDLVSYLFVYYRLGCESFVCSCGLEVYIRAIGQSSMFICHYAIMQTDPPGSDHFPAVCDHPSLGVTMDTCDHMSMGLFPLLF